MVLLVLSSESSFLLNTDIQPPVNGTYKLSETIPDYFSGIVLQRYHLASGSAYGTVKFQLAFNLAVVWMIVFVSLSKGLRSYGKVIYVFMLLPMFGTFVLCAKILGMMPAEYVNIVFPETSWNEFFLNSKVMKCGKRSVVIALWFFQSWVAAGQEVFLTWGLLGAAVMQIASHNKHKHLLQRDSSLVAVITFTILLLVAFLANTCVQILRSYGYSYLPDSFGTTHPKSFLKQSLINAFAEHISSYSFLRSSKDPLPPSLASTPVRYMVHNSFILGERVTRPGVDRSSQSGYQVRIFFPLKPQLRKIFAGVKTGDRTSPSNFRSAGIRASLSVLGCSILLHLDSLWHIAATGDLA